MHHKISISNKLKILQHCRSLFSRFRMEPNKEPKKIKIYKQQLSKNPHEKEYFDQNQKLDGKPSNLETKYVYEVYDKIAEHFSHTRYKAWPRVEKYLNSLEPNSLVADVGCGNGKYMGVNDSLLMVGTDRSKGLLDTAREKNPLYQLFAADSLKLPLRSQSFDHFISIAVIHHFSNDLLRHQAITELIRIIKVGGTGLIYVWAFEQEQRKFVEQDVFVPWNLHFKYEGQEELKKKKEAQIKAEEINEQKQTVVYKRYYHVFKEKELEGLLSEHKDLQIVESFYDHANWCVIVKRLF